MITKGVTEEAKISLDEIFKYFYAGRSARADNDRSNVFYDKMDFDYLEYIHLTGKIGGNITSNTGTVYADITNNPSSSEYDTNVDIGDLIDESIDVREVTGEENLIISLDSGETGKYIYLENFTLYRLDTYVYPA